MENRRRNCPDRKLTFWKKSSDDNFRRVGSVNTGAQYGIVEITKSDA